MNAAVALHADELSDVLYAKVEGASIRTSREAPNDGDLILNLDENGRVIGVQVLGALSLTAHAWLEHPDRRMLPVEVSAAVEQWLAAHPLNR
jgi:uncharacterized protein YuzE